MDPTDYAAEYEHKLKKAYSAAQAQGRDYVVCYSGGYKVHAARKSIMGNGVKHPRPLCQPHTPRSYASVYEDQTKPVTCKRCLASLDKR